MTLHKCIGSEQRSIKGKLYKVDKYPNFSIVHLNEQGKTILSIGYNPALTKENKDKNKNKSDNETPLERTRKTVITNFEGIEELGKIKELIQTDIFLDASPNIKVSKNEKINSIDIINELLNKSDYLLLGWGSEFDLSDTESYKELKEQLVISLKNFFEDTSKKMYWFGSNINNQPVHSASYKKDKMLREVSEEDFRKIIS